MDVLNLPIQMISVCEVDGNIRPLRFRFEDDFHQVRTASVCEVVATKELHLAGTLAYLYVCKSLIHETERIFELKYTVKTHRWVLFRIIS